MLPRLSRFLTCHNDVINAGQNNRLFAPGTDMDRERLRLSHMQKGTYYVQICDKYMLSGCELIDTENINLPSQNMKFGGE